jgi:hypothetical protein
VANSARHFPAGLQPHTPAISSRHYITTLEATR